MFASLTPQAAQQCFSRARLNAYQRFFGANSDQQTLGALMWHQRVASALWPLVGVVEIVFRNRTHFALSQLYGGLPSRSWYGGGPQDMRLKVGVQRKIDALVNLKDDAGNTMVHGVDDFISGTTFGIWIEVLQQLDQNRRHRFCSMAFPRYEPVKNKAAWVAPKNTWLALIGRIERHKAFRDRIAHHAPLWKIPFAPAVNAGPIRPGGPGAFIQSLRQEAAALRATMGEMEPGLADCWDGEAKRVFLGLTTLASIEDAMCRPPPPPATALAVSPPDGP